MAETQANGPVLLQVDGHGVGTSGGMPAERHSHQYNAIAQLVGHLSFSDASGPLGQQARDTADLKADSSLAGLEERARAELWYLDMQVLIVFPSPSPSPALCVRVLTREAMVCSLS